MNVDKVAMLRRKSSYELDEMWESRDPYPPDTIAALQTVISERRLAQPADRPKNELRSKPKSEPQRPQKMGLIGWALAGGVYFGGVPGHTAGSIGLASLAMGAFKIWGAMASAHDPEIKARLLPAFLLFGLLGVGFLVFGYYQYVTHDEPSPPRSSHGESRDPEKSPSAREPGGNIHE